MSVKRLPIVDLIVEDEPMKPKVRKFFVDLKLKEYRNVNNPHEAYSFDDVNAPVNIILKSAS